MTTFFAIIIVFGVLIAIHEFGHFLVAKMAGVQVDEYAIGFGPALISFRYGETRYSLRIFPLGGYCKMAGMVPDEKEQGKITPAGRAFHEKPVLSRMAIIAAGPIMNFLLAFLFFAFTFSVLGLPSQPTLVVDKVEAGYPADQAGIRTGDEIVAIDGEPVQSWNDLVQKVRSRPGENLRFTIIRQGNSTEISLAPREDANGNGVVGISPRMKFQRYGFVESLSEGALWTWNVVAGWFLAIGELISGGGGQSADVVGPVGISAQIGQAAQMGLPYLLLLSAILSANLGLVNLLPIPALDGSRLVFLLFEAIRGRPVAPEKENFIHFVGFALLILLSLVITYRDVLRLSLG